jgi:hypothetical protein
VDATGNEVRSKAFADLIDLDQAMNPDGPADVPQTGVLQVEDGRFRVLDAEDQAFAVRRLTLQYTFIITETRRPFHLRRYQSGAADLEIASSHAGDDEAKAEFMLISSPTGMMGIMTHHPHANPRVKVGDLPSRPLSVPVEAIERWKHSDAD